jgi:methionyl-tRNA synthetase
MNKYITTTLPYVNADQHIGFALELVQADVLARAWRAQGHDVFFSTGTDEHGQKVFEAAKKLERDTQEYTDEFAERVKSLKELLKLQTDAFIRTTDSHHIHAAQEMWRRCEAAGDIYKKSYTGLYCVGCEEFKTERELNDSGHCLLHPNIILQEITEENYFFKLSKYTDALLSYLSKPNVVIPEWRREEAENFIKAGLHDISISREKEKLSWGVPVPGDETQVMYVWFDALTSYISVLDWPETKLEGKFEKYWNEAEVVQMAGKDQVRFQSLLWQAMLLSAQIKNTDTVFYHGFINSGGARMSKSLGNVIAPHEVVEKYGADATRYMLLRHVHPVDDSDVTWEKFDEWYTAHLVNGLGNLVARVMKLAEDYLKPVGASTEIVSDYLGLVTSFEFAQAQDAVWKKIQETDEKITREEPFKLVKTDPEKGKESIRALVKELQTIANTLAISMPETSEKILIAIKENKKPENLFPRLS